MASSVAFPDLRGVLPGYGRFDPCDWGLGFEVKGDKAPHWTGTRTTPATFGHFGRAGGFVWVDPGAGLACATLSNRDFGPWAVTEWSTLADAVVEEWATEAPAVAPPVEAAPPRGTPPTAGTDDAGTDADADADTGTGTAIEAPPRPRSAANAVPDSGRSPTAKDGRR
jgi:hypothetical protein